MILPQRFNESDDNFIYFSQEISIGHTLARSLMTAFARLNMAGNFRYFSFSSEFR